MQYPEKQFEKELERACAFLGFYYCKIPDAQGITARNRAKNRELKRPFDAVLIVPNGIYCVECKINSGKLSEHQRANEKRINEINGSFLIFRKRISKTSNSTYACYKNNVKIIESDSIIDFLKKIVDIS